MARTVKQKIRLGTLFLFFLLLVTGGVSTYHLIRLKNDANEILKDNYESLYYCHSMQRYLDSVPINQVQSFSQFDSVLKLQENNITEAGESEVTVQVRKSFNLYRSGDKSLTTIQHLRAGIQGILGLNMAAIEIKNEKASNTARF